jgi:hypothetical protein
MLAPKETAPQQSGGIMHCGIQMFLIMQMSIRLKNNI